MTEWMRIRVRRGRRQFTFIKYEIDFPSGSMALIRAALDHLLLPCCSILSIFVPGGSSEKIFSIKLGNGEIVLTSHYILINAL